VLIGDRKNWSEHLTWIYPLVAVTIGLAIWWVAAWVLAGRAPAGSSLIGFVCGLAGGLIILFEFSLWPRKKYFRHWRLGRAVWWMRAHIWLGLFTVPLILIHSGLRLGGWLSTLLVILFVIIILSGVYGLILQQYLPRKMWEDVPAETIYSQIDHIAELLNKEAERLVLATCGPAPGEPPPPIDEELGGAATGTHLTVGAVRSVGKVKGKVVQTRIPRTPIPESEALRTFYRDSLEPFLEGRAPANSPLHTASRAADLFEQLRIQLDPAAHPVVDDLQGLAEQRRELDEQRRLHWWLHSWLWIHLPLSAALVVLMILHIVVALKYW
jgi:hypothetical protein